MPSFCHVRKATGRGAPRAVRHRSRWTCEASFLKISSLATRASWTFTTPLVAHRENGVRLATVVLLAGLVRPLAAGAASPLLYESSLGCPSCFWDLVLAGDPADPNPLR